jgi:hypothetical protein
MNPSGATARHEGEMSADAQRQYSGPALDEVFIG